LKSSYFYIFQTPVIPEIILKRANFAVLRKVLEQSSRPGTFTENDFERYVESWSKDLALTSMINWYRAFARHRVRIDSICKVPTKIIWGARDHFLQKEFAEFALQRCERGQLEFFQNAGHWVHLEESSAVADSITSFVRF
jgi:pimeloyl-ACP methyl ester carboxylesterase